MRFSGYSPFFLGYYQFEWSPDLYFKIIFSGNSELIKAQGGEREEGIKRGVGRERK